MDIPHCSLSVWRNLYDAAMTFRDFACWDWMSDLDGIKVQMAKRLPTVERARKALLKHLANQR